LRVNGFVASRWLVGRHRALVANLGANNRREGRKDGWMDDERQEVGEFEGQIGEGGEVREFRQMYSESANTFVG
jgi:hypothetical protein